MVRGLRGLGRTKINDDDGDGNLMTTLDFGAGSISPDTALRVEVIHRLFTAPKRQVSM